MPVGGEKRENINKMSQLGRKSPGILSQLYEGLDLGIGPIQLLNCKAF